MLLFLTLTLTKLTNVSGVKSLLLLNNNLLEQGEGWVDVVKKRKRRKSKLTTLNHQRCTYVCKLPVCCLSLGRAQTQIFFALSLSPEKAAAAGLIPQPLSLSVLSSRMLFLVLTPTDTQKYTTTFLAGVAADGYFLALPLSFSHNLYFTPLGGNQPSLPLSLLCKELARRFRGVEGNLYSKFVEVGN